MIERRKRIIYFQNPRSNYSGKNMIAFAKDIQRMNYNFRFKSQFKKRDQNKNCRRSECKNQLVFY